MRTTIEASIREYCSLVIARVLVIQHVIQEVTGASQI